MKVFRFYAVAFVFSWAVWILGIFLLNCTIAPTVLVSIGGLGPVVGLIIHLIFSYDKTARRDYMQRLLRFKGFSAMCWVWAVIIPVSCIAAAGAIDSLVSAQPFAVFTLDSAFMEAGLGSAVFLLLFGPIPEEMAWRGVAFDALAKKGIIRAQCIVALLWALWHIPLFFIKGSYQHGLGLFTPSFFMFFINIIFLSIITGWLYIKSSGSILVAVAFHYIVNLSGEMFALSLQGEVIKTVLTGAVCVILIVRQITVHKTSKQKITV